jgi:hypothetical protein
MSRCCAHSPCPQLPGTIIRIFIPAGATINILNIIELTSPSGICIILRSPILGSIFGPHHHRHLERFCDDVRAAGGTVEFL